MSRIKTIFATLPFVSLPVQAQDASKEYEVKAGPFRQQIVVDGIVQPAAAKGLSVDPKQWKQLVLKEIVPHGTAVKTGDTIAVLDVEALQKQVEKVTRSREAARIQLERAELELATFRKSSPLDLEALRRAATQAKENLENWKTIWRPLEIEEADQNLKGTEQQLFSAQEELRQLEVMYKADDLTEETEEIQLKRARWGVERMEFALKQAKQTHKDTTEISLPRADKERQEARDRTSIALEKGEKDNAASLRLRELDAIEKRHAFEEEEKNFTELKADLEMLSAIKSPADGHVLWGDWTSGEGPAELAEFDKKHAANPRACINPIDIFATVVSGTPSRITTNLSAEQRRLAGWRASGAEIKADGTPYATFEAAPELATGIRVESIATFPSPQGQFPATLTFSPTATNPGATPQLVPGMKAKLVLSDYEKADAFSIPANFIETAFKDGKTTETVLVKLEGGASEKRTVSTGRRNGKTVEILDGLKAGEKLSVPTAP